MTAGRKPKPVALKLIEGNRGKRRIPKTPMPPPELLAPPAGMCAPARKEWDRVAPQLDRLGLLTGLDRAALHAYCEAYARRCAAERHVHSKGIMVGRVKNPAAQIIRDASMEMRAWCSEFGMTPSARARMVLPDEKNLDLDRFMSGD